MQRLIIFFYYAFGKELSLLINSGFQCCGTDEDEGVSQKNINNQKTNEVNHCFDLNNQKNNIGNDLNQYFNIWKEFNKNNNI